MVPSWSSLKAMSRRAVHDTFKVQATYQDQFLESPVPVYVRWHNRIGVIGQETSQGYAEVIEGIDRIIFSREELEETHLISGTGKPVKPMKNGVVTLVDPLFNNAKLVLDTKQPDVGPIDEVWNVNRA